MKPALQNTDYKMNKNEIIKTKLKKLAPPGSHIDTTLKLFISEVVIMALISLTAIVKIRDANYKIFHDQFGYYHDSGKMMPYFGELITGSLMLIWVILLFNIAFGIANYMSFSKGSKSIYVMKRVPDSKEMFRRSFALPFAGIALALIVAIILLIIFYLAYRTIPPLDRIYPVQLIDFLRAFI